MYSRKNLAFNFIFAPLSHLTTFVSVRLCLQNVNFEIKQLNFFWCFTGREGLSFEYSIRSFFPPKHWLIYRESLLHADLRGKEISAWSEIRANWNMGLIGSAEPFYSFGTYGIEQFKSISLILAFMDYKNHTFDTNIGFANSFGNLMGSVEFIKICLSLPLKIPHLANPHELKPREAGIPCTTNSLAGIYFKKKTICNLL